MVKLDLTAFKYLSNEDFRVLVAVEMGMKNHDLVPTQLINSLARIKRGDVVRAISDCHMNKLVYHMSKVYDGYRLTYRGYDYLSIRTHTKRENLAYIGNQIGTGKESDVFLGMAPDGTKVAVKFHRLGRISFRSIKRNRNYHKNRKHASWLYLSRLAALKEFAYMKALYDHGFCVPRPIDVNRHVVIMEYLENARPLHNVHELKNPALVYSNLMDLLVKLAECGLIHSDFNEFNLMIDEDENITLIDFPQMVSIDHVNAEMYFDRDVQEVRDFFRRRFKIDAAEYPVLGKDISRKYTLDFEIEASGFNKKLEKEMEKLKNDQRGSEEESADDELQELQDDPVDICHSDPLSCDVTALLFDAPRPTERVAESSCDVVGQRTNEGNETDDEGYRKQKNVLKKDERSAGFPPNSGLYNQDDATHSECELPAASVTTEDIIQDMTGDGRQQPTGHFTRESVIHYRVKSQLDKKRQHQKIRIRNDFKLKAKRELKQQSLAWEIEM